MIERQAKERLESFDVQPRNTQLDCGALSGGNLQRLVLARELGHDTPLLVAVNPTSGLDAAGAGMVRAKLRSHAERGKTILMISNDLDELLAVADRLAVLFDGKLIELESTGTPTAESLGLLMGGVKADTVRALSRPPNVNSGDADEARNALHELLQGDERLQRGLAAHLGWRVFITEDVPNIRDYLASEGSEEIRIWLRITLTKLVGEPECDALVRAFASNPSGFAEAQRKISNAPDYKTLKEVLLGQLNRDGVPWERILAILTLRHLGVSTSHKLPFDLASPNVEDIVICAAEKGAGG